MTTRRLRIHPAVSRAGASVTILISALGVTGAPPARAYSASDFGAVLTSVDSSLTAGAAAEALLEAERQAIEVNNALSFMTPAKTSIMPEYVRDLAYFHLQSLLAEANRSDPSFRYPFMLTEPGGNPIQLAGDPNPDNIFNMAFIKPDGTYVIHFTPGGGSIDFNITPQLNFSPTNLASQPLPAINLKDLTPNADGSYTITVSSTPHDGNWIDPNGATGLWVRDTLGDWAKAPGTVTIDRIDVPSSPTAGYTPMSEADVALLLNKMASTFAESNENGQFFYTPQPGLPVLDNQVTPVIPTDIQGGLPGQYLSIGGFNLEPGQALILTEPSINAGYYNIQLFDPMTRMLPFQYHQTSLNNFQAIPNEDGNTYYVISATNPGVPNWLDTTGLAEGGIFMRFQNPTGALPTGPFETQVVPVADIRDYLPEGTPTVTPEEFAQQMDLRAFSVQNFLSASKDHSWITLNLQMDDIKDAIGVARFEELFSTQDDVISLPERFTHSLSVSDALDNVLNNPLGSFDAVVHSLRQVVNDVQYPMILAMTRAAEVVGGATQSFDSDFSIGHLEQMFNGLASVMQETFLDPETSITAGLLNARDDILFALVAGVTDSPDFSQFISDAQVALAQTAEALSQNSSLAFALVEQALGF